MEYGKVDEKLNMGKGIAGLVEATSMAQLAAFTAEERKAKGVRILDVRSISSVADYFVICSGNSTPHLRAIADDVEKQLAKQGLLVRHTEGYRNGKWILLDFGDLVVHVMRDEEREFYGLERLWGDAIEIEVQAPAAV